jgi:hypothetical protein
MRTERAGSPVAETQDVTRQQRSDAAVMAQYIQDLTRQP